MFKCNVATFIFLARFFLMKDALLFFPWDSVLHLANERHFLLLTWDFVFHLVNERHFTVSALGYCPSSCW
jgi:hypothetical protein